MPCRPIVYKVATRCDPVRNGPKAQVKTAPEVEPGRRGERRTELRGGQSLRDDVGGGAVDLTETAPRILGLPLALTDEHDVAAGVEARQGADQSELDAPAGSTRRPRKASSGILPAW